MIDVIDKKLLQSVTYFSIVVSGSFFLGIITAFLFGSLTAFVIGVAFSILGALVILLLHNRSRW